MNLKRVLILTSIIFNILIISCIVYVFTCSSFTPNIENEEVQKKNVNFDSINNLNKVKLIEINPEGFREKINNLSKNKKCVVIFWASWCSYCPALIKVIIKLKTENKFNLLMVSIDKPNEKGKASLLKKISTLKLKNEQYITNINDYLDISNSKVIYKYLNDVRAFDMKPGFPHILIYQNNEILFEDTGYDDVYGVSKYINLLK